MSTQGEMPAGPRLRVRGQPSAPYVPIGPVRSMRRARTSSGKEDFLEFIDRLGRIVASPVTIPLRLAHKIATSPTTISLVLRLTLLLLLLLGSGAFSVLAVGAFWWTWTSGKAVEVEGWLTYGSKSHRIPHSLIPLPLDRFQEDLRYDVVVEMELVRPGRASADNGNFMLSLDMRSARTPEMIVISAAQPSLPPPATVASMLSLPSISTVLIPPCVIPWPFRGLCPSRLLGYAEQSSSLARKKRRGGNDAVLLSKTLMEGVMVNPSLGGDAVLGSAFVSIGREDHFSDDLTAPLPKEVRTTGWVILRFVPRPTGIRWILTSHPLLPLLTLPPVSLALTLSSSTVAFLVITYFTRSRQKGGSKRSKSASTSRDRVQETEARKRRQVLEEREREEINAERRRVEAASEAHRGRAQAPRTTADSVSVSCLCPEWPDEQDDAPPSAAHTDSVVSDADSERETGSARTESANLADSTAQTSRRNSETSSGWEDAT